MTGMNISWPPIAFISSRTICTAFSCTRQPRGRNVQRPAETWRMKPPRTSRRWLTASASPGSSRRVGMKSSEALICLARTLGRFGHQERGRLRQLQPLGTLHPVRDPLVDLVEELVDEDVRGNLLQHAAMGVDEAGIAPARD